MKAFRLSATGLYNVYLSYFPFLPCLNPQVERLRKITTGLCLSTVSATTLILAGKYKEDSSTKNCATIHATCLTRIPYEGNTDVKLTSNI